MRSVGHSQWREFAATPEEALERGARLDAMARLPGVPDFQPRGVFRGPHAFFVAMDEEKARQRQAWFSLEANQPNIENIRLADRIVIDILFAANGETYESLQAHVRLLDIDGVTIPVLDIDGLLKAKTDYREKDQLDKAMLRLRDETN